MEIQRAPAAQPDKFILDILSTAEEFRRIRDALEGGKGPAAAFGLPLPHKAHVIAALSQHQTALVVTATDTAAVQLAELIGSFGPDASLFLPRETPLVHVCAVSGELRTQRLAALTKLVCGLQTVIVAPIAACMQALAPKAVFAEHAFTVRTGDELSPRSLVERLVAAGYERTELAETRGQVAARGDLVDVFAPQEQYPVRIEFFGDEIDQMRAFDPVTQRSVEQRFSAILPPAYETPQPKESMRAALKKIGDAIGFAEQQQYWQDGIACAGADALIPLLFAKSATLLDYLPPDACIFADEALLIDEAARTEQARFTELVTAMLERGEGLPAQAHLERGAAETVARLDTQHTLLMYALSRAHPLIKPRTVVQFLARTAPQYMGNLDELARDEALWRNNGETVLLFAGEHAQRIADALHDHGGTPNMAASLDGRPPRGELTILPQRLKQGLCYPSLKLTVLTEYELFGKSERPAHRSRKRSALAFSELSVGDYIVHEAHGIGRFVKVEPLTVQGHTRDYLLIEYRGGDRLYIPTDQLDRIQKYVGGGEDEESIPPLSKLGGTEWSSRVERAKSAAKKLAVDLAALYAARLQAKGFAFSKDTKWQTLFEERFPYEETPDQKASIADIKADMELPRPMDRLLCGDVGYGKTEVALRACFKAVQDGKQVAILVPTTILAQQHYNTIQSRFADYPVHAACLSRFQQPKERAKIKQGLTDGSIDLVVGTHALLAKDVRFKDLGLLVIDEEHRFGVNHKEQIKAYKQTVDVLTLTATPIPRTLNMSMAGVRDISVIETPPEERYPVQTFVLEYTDALLTDAISREVARGGQVYVVYNRVQSIESIAGRIHKLLPEVQTIVAHGQMNEMQLENAMLDFMAHKADVLLCTTIIESGLDIPNANTLIILEADHMGLAQLYQLRGRVGRGNRLGYAYFTVCQSRAVNDKAVKRLMAIREFTQFGAGFRLAMRDLEIRGAGSLLGAEQHGHITDVGYEYYTKLVRRAVEEARGVAQKPPIEPSVDIPFDAHIPHSYIKNEVQRLRVYRRIADIDGREAVPDVTEELIDRYGEPPKPVENLILTALIKAYAANAYVLSVAVRDGQADLQFAEGARIDGGRLLGAVSGMQGAQLLATDPPGIRIRQKNVPAAELAAGLPDFLYALSDCALPME